MWEPRALLPPCKCEGNLPMAIQQEAAKSGITFGCALAIAISWSANKSILWAIIHGLFSWFYVIYYAVVKR